MTVKLVGVHVWGLLYLKLHFGSFGWFGQVQCIRISLNFASLDFTAQILFSSGVVGRLNLWFPSWWLLASSVSKPESNCLIGDSTHKLKGDQVICGSTSILILIHWKSIGILSHTPFWKMRNGYKWLKLMKALHLTSFDKRFGILNVSQLRNNFSDRFSSHSSESAFAGRDGVEMKMMMKMKMKTRSAKKNPLCC